MATKTVRPTRFPLLEIAGTDREIGRKIGEARRDHIRELVDLVVARFNKGSKAPVTVETAAEIAAGTVPFVERYAPHLMEEVRGTAEGAGVRYEQIMLLNARNMLSSARVKEGCTSVMISPRASSTGGQVGGQNWDNDPAMDAFSLVMVRKPKGRPANMTWGQPGLIAYIGQNDRGIGVLMNALNGPSARNGVPWYFIVRSIYEQSTLAGIASAAEKADRAITANAALVSQEGAADLEVTPDEVRMLHEDPSGRLVHTNHCVHPDLQDNNGKYSFFGQSVERKSRAEAILSGKRDPVGVEMIKQILSDHDGYPTAICRHPNSDPVTGWQRSVVSIILEPASRRMHVSRGNPCETPYETYEME